MSRKLRPNQIAALASGVVLGLVAGSLTSPLSETDRVALYVMLVAANILTPFLGYALVHDQGRFFWAFSGSRISPGARWSAIHQQFMAILEPFLLFALGNGMGLMIAGIWRGQSTVLTGLVATCAANGFILGRHLALRRAAREQMKVDQKA